jgi:receptor protein-tyrosine kinase
MSSESNKALEGEFIIRNEDDTGPPGVIEAALNKIGPRRQVILRQGEEVVPGPQLSSVLDLNDPHGEQIRALRTALLLLCSNAPTAVVLAVVSPCRGEGRSQLAAELALSFAQLDKKTLLVDADMRRPTLHQLFDSSGRLGLAEAIITNSDPYLHPVKKLPRMHFVTAGEYAQTNPLELLSDSRFSRLVQHWRASYSYVVIDTPPIGEFADGLAVATLAGRVLSVSRARHTPYKEQREMMRRLAITQARVLGAVLSHF